MSEAKQIKVTVNSQRLNNVLKQLSLRMKDMLPLYEEIGAEVVDATIEAFDKETSPFGDKWPQLKRPRRRNKKAAKQGKEGGTKILQDTGALKNSIHAEATSKGVEIGSDRVYAAIHQFGGTINRKAGTGSVRLKRSKKSKRVRFAKASEKKNVTEKSFSHGPYTITIPARPYLPIKGNSLPPKLNQRIIDVMQKYFVGGQQ